MAWDEFAWAVGIFEGEGSMGFYTWVKRGDKLAVMQVMMTDEDTIRRFHRAVGGVGRVRGPIKHTNNPRAKMLWQWRLQNYRDVYALLNRMLPHLGERRRKRAVELLHQLEQRPRFKWPSDQLELPAA